MLLVKKKKNPLDEEKVIVFVFRKRELLLQKLVTSQ